MFNRNFQLKTVEWNNLWYWFRNSVQAEEKRPGRVTGLESVWLTGCLISAGAFVMFPRNPGTVSKWDSYGISCCPKSPILLKLRDMIQFTLGLRPLHVSLGFLAGCSGPRVSAHSSISGTSQVLWRQPKNCSRKSQKTGYRPSTVV